MSVEQCIALLVIAFLVVWILLSRRRCEDFQVVNAANEHIPLTNTGPNIWQRHPISSIPMDQVVKYEKMYMVEFDNKRYEDALRTTFGVPNAKSSAETKDIRSWTILNPQDPRDTSYIQVAYNELIAYIERTINESKAFHLPYDNKEYRPKIQIVHDVLLQFRRHINNQYKYMMTVDLILYREHKHQGKHVNCEAIVEYKPDKQLWTYTIVNISVQGIVSEDSVGMFPVVPHDATQPRYEDANAVDSSVLLRDEDVITVITQQNKLHQAAIQSELAILQS